jgi:hypothetical protein
MNTFDHPATLTDQLERKLIQQEIAQQMAFAPAFDFKRITDKIAALFGYVRIDTVPGEARAAH